MTSPVIPFVLFRLTVRDFNNHLYHDAMYNLNSTPLYFQLDLDIVPIAYFAYFSTVDGYGLDFSDARLYVNGSWTTTQEPIMLSKNVRVEVWDYFGSRIYLTAIDFSVQVNTTTLIVNGTNVGLGIPLANVIISNLYNNRTVDFYLTKAGKTIMYQVPPSSSYIMRLALGNYEYRVVDSTTGTVLYETTVVTIAASKSISLGFATAVVPEIPQYQFTWFDTLISIGVFVAVVVAAVAAFNWKYYRRIDDRTKEQLRRGGSLRI
jgi:hypothetical protein